MDSNGTAKAQNILVTTLLSDLSNLQNTLLVFSVATNLSPLKVGHFDKPQEAIQSLVW